MRATKDKQVKFPSQLYVTIGVEEDEFIGTSSPTSLNDLHDEPVALYELKKVGKVEVITVISIIDGEETASTDGGRNKEDAKHSS